MKILAFSLVVFSACLMVAHYFVPETVEVNVVLITQVRHIKLGNTKRI